MYATMQCPEMESVRPITVCLPKAPEISTQRYNIQLHHPTSPNDETRHSLVRILIMLTSDVPTGGSLLGVFGFGNLVLVSSV
jgi:hypothetical protein